MSVQDLGTCPWCGQSMRLNYAESHVVCTGSCYFNNPIPMEAWKNTQGGYAARRLAASRAISDMQKQYIEHLKRRIEAGKDANREADELLQELQEENVKLRNDVFKTRAKSVRSDYALALETRRLRDENERLRLALKDRQKEQRPQPPESVTEVWVVTRLSDGQVLGVRHVGPGDDWGGDGHKFRTTGRSDTGENIREQRFVVSGAQPPKSVAEAFMARRAPVPDAVLTKIAGDAAPEAWVVTAGDANIEGVYSQQPIMLGSLKAHGPYRVKGPISQGRPVEKMKLLAVRESACDECAKTGPLASETGERKTWQERAQKTEQILARERSIYADKPEDRLFHAADRTWWRRDPETQRLRRAEPPEGWMRVGATSFPDVTVVKMPERLDLDDLPGCPCHTCRECTIGDHASIEGLGGCLKAESGECEAFVNWKAAITGCPHCERLPHFDGLCHHQCSVTGKRYDKNPGDWILWVRLALHLQESPECCAWCPVSVNSDDCPESHRRDCEPYQHWKAERTVCVVCGELPATGTNDEFQFACPSVECVDSNGRARWFTPAEWLKRNEETNEGRTDDMDSVFERAGDAGGRGVDGVASSPEQVATPLERAREAINWLRSHAVDSPQQDFREAVLEHLEQMDDQKANRGMVYQLSRMLNRLESRLDALEAAREDR